MCGCGDATQASKDTDYTTYSDRGPCQASTSYSRSCNVENQTVNQAPVNEIGIDVEGHNKEEETSVK